MMHTDDDLIAAAHLIATEWTELAEIAGLLARFSGIRGAAEQAWMDAFFVHDRCLINFLCGGYKGRWQVDDIKPADFLGDLWTLEDEDLDRQLRGRLATINSKMAHLTWKNFTDDAPIIWNAGSLAHETHYAMGLFVAALEAAGRPGLGVLKQAQATAQTSLPALRKVRQTAAPQAPLRHQ